jgi:hypothetical protein
MSIGSNLTVMLLMEFRLLVFWLFLDSTKTTMFALLRFLGMDSPMQSPKKASFESEV